MALSHYFHGLFQVLQDVTCLRTRLNFLGATAAPHANMSRINRSVKVTNGTGLSSINTLLNGRPGCHVCVNMPLAT